MFNTSTVRLTRISLGSCGSCSDGCTPPDIALSHDTLPRRTRPLRTTVHLGPSLGSCSHRTSSHEDHLPSTTHTHTYTSYDHIWPSDQDHLVYILSENDLSKDPKTTTLFSLLEGLLPPIQSWYWTIICHARISHISGDDREVLFLFQRISATIQRFNSVLLHDSFSIDWPDH